MQTTNTIQNQFETKMKELNFIKNSNFENVFDKTIKVSERVTTEVTFLINNETIEVMISVNETGSIIHEQIFKDYNNFLNFVKEKEAQLKG